MMLSSRDSSTPDEKNFFERSALGGSCFEADPGPNLETSEVLL